MSDSPKMTPGRLVIFRCLNLTLGRWPAFGRWLKRRLSRRLMAGQGAPYCQCANFFEFDQLGRPGPDREGGAS